MANSIRFMVSLNKMNAKSERAKLIKAGLLLNVQNNLWMHLIVYPTLNSNQLKGDLYLDNGYRIFHPYQPKIILTASQFIDVFNLIVMAPHLNLVDLLKTVPLNQRNLTQLRYTQLGDALGIDVDLSTNTYFIKQ